MNNVFEQKKFLGKIFFSGPPGPPTEKFFGPGPGRPGRAGGGPKGGPDRSVGVCNPSKTVGRPQKWFLKPNTHVKTFCLARNSSSSQSYARNTFLASVGGFLPVLGAGWGEPETRGLQDPQKSKIQKSFLF